VVAPARVRRWAWPAAAGVAAAFIAAAAFHGNRPQSGLARFAPAGVLASWPLDQVAKIEVTAGATHHSFHRHGSEEWRTEHGDTPAAADLAKRIETGLRLLRNSAPQRTLDASEMAGRSRREFGLEPPLLTVTVARSNHDSITIHFGGANPLGLARYVQIAGRPEVLLLSAFVADPWERLAEQP
jgi:hypothetical protein